MKAQIEFSKDFLPLFKKRPASLVFELSPNHQNIKHEIELHGIPHTAVGHIWLSDEEVDFYYAPEPGDQLYVEPLEFPVDVTEPTWLRPVAYPAHRFLVDQCVAALTPKLRMRGCDVLADPSMSDRDIAFAALEEQRVLLTRNRRLLMRKEIEWGYYVSSTDPTEQVEEVVARFAIPWLPEAFLRCLSCNGWLLPVAKSEILDQLEPKTILHYNDFSRCDGCHKIYWEGSHFQKMRQASALNGPPSNP